MLALESNTSLIAEIFDRGLSRDVLAQCDDENLVNVCISRKLANKIIKIKDIMDFIEDSNFYDQVESEILDNVYPNDLADTLEKHGYVVFSESDERLKRIYENDIPFDFDESCIQEAIDRMKQNNVAEALLQLERGIPDLYGISRAVK